VARLRRVLRTRAVGHTGTLDPFATGLLVVLVGRGTRLARFVETLPKTYLATVRLGFRTTTDDSTGQAMGSGTPPPPVEVAIVREVLADFLGPQAQRPPAYSAKRVRGERSYARARRGEAVELPEADIVVHALELLGYAYPELLLRLTVSAGTYVRGLARDLGERLGVGAHLAALRREAIGTLRVEQALPLEAVGPETPLLPPLAVLGHLARIELGAEEAAAVRHGRVIRPEVWCSGPVALMHDGELVAIARGGVAGLRPAVVLESA